MEYKTNDGWDLESIYPLGEFVSGFDSISNNVYELKNCVRTKSLIEMRDELLEEIESMKLFLEEIEDDDAVKEEDE